MVNFKKIMNFINIKFFLHVNYSFFSIIFIFFLSFKFDLLSEDTDFDKYALFASTAKRGDSATPVDTKLPLEFKKDDRIALIGNTLFDRMRDYGYFESIIQQSHPNLNLVIRNLAWSADEIDLQPRPDNFADTEQHLTAMKADIIIAAFGFNESFAGEKHLSSFKTRLSKYLLNIRSKSYNSQSPPQVVLVSPIANENVPGVDAAKLNNSNIKAYTEAMRLVAKEQNVGFVDTFTKIAAEMAREKSALTINGSHLNSLGYSKFSDILFEGLTNKKTQMINEDVREAVLEKNKQHFFRYRPLNTFYYTGGRKGRYGYLDFLPAMKNFDLMTYNRDMRIHNLVKGVDQGPIIDDSNVPPLPKTSESRGANQWMTPEDELNAFEIDPRFEVSLFASEEQFPDIACPIQMRWDSKGRMWVSCSTTYPHVYPGQSPNDKIVILEDLDKDGKADTCSIWADGLNIPLSFEFGNGGVYVSEEPHMTFLKDTNGDGKADLREIPLTGFGCEDSHHALHDFAWTPDGDLIFRESIFHHSQVETPYGPVRQRNSGWFAWEPKIHRLTSFGSHPSTNPWGVTFDKWGNHVASYPIFASAHHALDPPYPEQHPRPTGMQAYSGVCGQEFIDFPNWPKELKGMMVKVRYKPTNRVELLEWKEYEYGYEEKYISDIIFSKNLSFIPVDLRFGPMGGMYVCDWYNPIKGHAQYSLRDNRRDRKSGRIWRIMPKGSKGVKPPKISGANINQLLNLLKRPEYRYRYWAKREIREMPSTKVKKALDLWVKKLNKDDPQYRHHQVEAIWTYRNLELTNLPLLKELLNCENHYARAAAAKQLRYWHGKTKDGNKLLGKAAKDPNGLVRMEAAIACSYIGTKEAFNILKQMNELPNEKHLNYAIITALGSHKMRNFWDPKTVDVDHPEIATILSKNKRKEKEAEISKKNSKFDRQRNLLSVKIKCLKERMLFDFETISANKGQPIRLEFYNPDATPHNFVLVEPGSLEEIGQAANLMATDPIASKTGQFIPDSKKIIVHTKMLKQEEKEILRFYAPKKPGEYPYMCTFPGHWTIMKGILVVK
jgi:azurin